MKSCRAALFLAVTASVLACGDEREPCTTCPDIADTYRVDSAVQTGACAFTPVVLGTQVALVQSADGTEVSLAVADPVSQQELTLVATVFDEDDADVLASFAGTQQLVRPATGDGEEVLRLRFVIAGSVSMDEGRRVLSGTLITEDMGAEGAFCRTVLTFSGAAAPALAL